MPHLLHTVVLSTMPQTVSFISSIVFQKSLGQDSPLALDYSKHIRRLWCDQCWEDGNGPYGSKDYSAFYQIIRGVDLLGLNFRALHFLYKALALDSPDVDPSKDWTCQQIIFTGFYPTWQPLMFTNPGMALLKRITHLMFWMPAQQGRRLSSPANNDYAPEWVEEIPFEWLPNLTHFAFPLVRADLSGPTPVAIWVPDEILAYVAPTPNFKPAVFREWALSRDPVRHGVVTTFRTPPIYRIGRSQVKWEPSFTMGEASRIRSEVEDRLAKLVDA